jgi:hypothetical protein
MRKLAGVKRLGFAVAVVFVTLLATSVYAGDVTVTGEVNDNYQLVADGQIYEIADTPEGNDMVENHISAKVKVTGQVETQDDVKVMYVSHFEVVGE